MNLWRYTLGVVIAGATMAGSASGQQVRLPDTIRPTGFTYDYYAQDPPVPETQSSPSDIVPPINQNGNQNTQNFVPVFDNSPWALVPENVFGLQAGGWMSMGVTVNAHGNRTGTGNAPLGFNNIGDGFVVNQLWGFLGREADTSDQVFDFGFRFDYVFGVDGPDTQAFGDNGWDFGWNSNSRGDYGSAIPQIYGEVAMNDLSVIIGHFYTIIGYEVVQAPNNFFYSHAYTMVYGEPFTHTGALATYSMSDDITLYGGYTFGWDSGFDNFFEAHTYLGGIGVQLTDDIGLTWALNTGSFGDGTTTGGNVGNIYMQSLVLDVALTDDWQWIGQTDFGTNTEVPAGGVPGAGNNQWYGVNMYSIYTINDRWSTGTRSEWFVDSNGARVGNGPGAYNAMTFGVNWSPIPNVRFRPEVRWDWFDPYAGGGRIADPVNGVNTRNSLMTLGIDGIVLF